ALAHQGRAHVVGDDGGVDAVAHQLPGGQPSALYERSGLVGGHSYLFAFFNRAADDAERRAVAGRGERARVAVGQDPRIGWHHIRADRAQRAAVGDVFVVDLLRLPIQVVFQL